MDLPSQAIWQGFFNGIALGWIYILMALGLTLIFGIMNIMQFAHGEIYMVGAYVVYYLTASNGVNLFVATLLSMIVMAVFGIFLERLLFRHVRGQVLSPIVVSVGLTLILQSGAVAGFGVYERSVPRLSQGSFEIVGSMIPKDRIVAVVCAMTLILVLYVFLKRFKYGQAMVASAQHREGAILQGISPNKMSAMAMAIGCSLAAAGGALAGSLLMLDPFMGTQPLLKGLVIIVLGGMGSLLGAAIGGMIVGLIDGLVPILFGPAPASLLPLIIVIFILVVRPRGLFGHE
ncbi:MAG: branched-chain amino acid ABC transporter permease [Deltaproteobacteria bacterium]|nr:branched-chain amino acid ABC transporter permease [Deltaproteobacteria bacterium]